jgi:hypothetical protein
MKSARGGERGREGGRKKKCQQQKNSSAKKNKKIVIEHANYRGEAHFFRVIP